ncbi:MAG: dihydrofolate reductase family protein [Euryarchaeota archaeon]|nr:dihydrofolate reductase family protein [Euryarchaeota archaeon]MDE1837331.1 dihydrofolate reductase family protein [Euryarchaeota archaeon]MDE1881663.1 dihydrofolate reductase family protein [Euryarchaeota archaeon]MDE2045238.1 dihydrofolate reductase family protein [Thermoplasmata archaeon]
MTPLEVLLERTKGPPFPLPPLLRGWYGPLRLQARRGRPCVYANLACTLDGVASFGGRGSGGSDITGPFPPDRMVMGLLRAVADAVVVGAGTFRAIPHHRWIASQIYPRLAGTFARLRTDLGLPPYPVNVIVSASGELDLGLPVFHTPGLKVLVVTTRAGEARLTARRWPEGPEVWAGGEGPTLRARTVLRAISRHGPLRRVLLEGGPHLLGKFLKEGLLDDLFLTVAPQVGGRSDAARRVSLVEDAAFGPDRPLWAELRSVRSSRDHLFLRYATNSGGRRGGWTGAVPSGAPPTRGPKGPPRG